MMRINFIKIKNDLLKGLNKREKDIIERRFGLRKKEKETLESIGKSYGICRERVRQIEERAISQIKEKTKNPFYQNIFKKIIDHLKKKGGVEREDLLLKELGGEKFQNFISFFIRFIDIIKHKKEREKYFSLFYLDENALKEAEKIISFFVKLFEKEKRTLTEKEILKVFKKESKESLKKDILFNYLSLSKEISKGPRGDFGLISWPEINPKGVKDKAFLVFKIMKKPLHFKEVAELINNLKLERPISPKKVIPATVHNELIRDERFVLVGRGLYALREWGYEEGFVRDIIFKILKEAKKPLSREEIVKKVLSQRLVKENTILLNLQNKKYFIRNKEGKYTIKEV